MKFMKLGNRPDTFHSVEATRTVVSDIPTDLTIQIKKTSYLLHKYPLLPKCGLLQRLLAESQDSSNAVLDLHDVPGGDEAFELCAKFCYGITINLSAHNIVTTVCTAKFLGMTEAFETGNLVMKLETFYSSCILEGWKDSIVTLQNTAAVYEWSESLGIVRRSIESIVDKILTPPQKVSWSYTYTRPGYEKMRHQYVPKDWWTEDISFLDIDMFRCIMSAVKSTNRLQPQLIGEALHVYACQWLPEARSKFDSTLLDRDDHGSSDRKQRILETIVSLIPSDKGSVSFKFLLRLLTLANFLGVSPVTKAELLRFSGLQLEDSTPNDLLFPTQSQNILISYDFELVKTVLESFLRQWRRLIPADESQSQSSIHKVAKIIDSYLQVIAKDASTTVEKMVSLADMLPEVARPEHDNLYKAINIYLKEHPDLSKTDKKQLCRILDCQKFSPEVRAHAVKNERLPLRTVVQLVFFEQEKGSMAVNIRQTTSDKGGGVKEDDHHSIRVKGNRNSTPASDSSSSIAHPDLKKLGEKSQFRPELSFKITDMEKTVKTKEREIREEGVSEIREMNLHGRAREGRSSGQIHCKGRER